MGRILGLDYGAKRLGFALSDPTGTLATPLCVVPVSGERDALARIEQQCRATRAERLVIGLPKNMNNTLGPAAQDVLRLKAKLEPRLAIPIATWDERLSTAAANNAMIAADVSRARRKQVVDKLAAQLFLQNYLDAQVSLAARAEAALAERAGHANRNEEFHHEEREASESFGQD